MKYKNIINKIVICVIITLFIFLTYKLIFFYIPFLVAYIISIIIEPLIKFLNKRTRLTRKTSSIIVLVIIFSLLILVLIFASVKLISETTNLLEKLNAYLEKTISFIKYIVDNMNLDKLNLSNEVTSVFEKSTTDFLNSVAENVKNILKKLLEYITSLPNMFINFIITVLATYFITSDKFYILDRMEHHLSKKMVGKMIKHAKEIINSLGKYLKAELILSFITFIIVLTGLNIFYLLGMDIEYPIIMASIIGFVDVLPILGAGSIMIPWVVILFLNKNSSLGMAILGLYLFTLIAKQLLEPKIVSNNIGIHPIFTLFAMYTGYKFIGISGLIIGPIILIILKNIFSDAIEKGLVNSIVDN